MDHYINQKDGAPIPMAVATVVPLADQYSQGSTTARPTSTLLKEGRSKRVLVPQLNSKELSSNETEALKD